MHFSKDVLLIADKGYIGMDKIHGNSLVPKKSTKKHKLTKEDKKYNSIISRRRINLHRACEQAYQEIQDSVYTL